MTLTETLQIKERYLKFEDMRALDYAEKRWQEDGCPIKQVGVDQLPRTDAARTKSCWAWLSQGALTPKKGDSAQRFHSPTEPRVGRTTGSLLFVRR